MPYKDIWKCYSLSTKGSFFSVAIMVHLARDKSGWQTNVKKKQVNTGTLSTVS